MKTTQLSAPDTIQQTASAIQLRLINHRISAGFPSPATDYAEEGLDLNEYLVRRKSSTFLFTVKGDSSHSKLRNGNWSMMGEGGRKAMKVRAPMVMMGAVSPMARARPIITPVRMPPVE